jgi:hypothetical protein
MAHRPIAIQKECSKCLIIKNGFMALKPVPIAIQKECSKCLIIKNGFMALKPMPIEIQKFCSVLRGILLKVQVVIFTS